MPELVELLAGWPFAASLAVAFAAGGARGARRRRALNEAVHELRRPLQALALAPAAAGSSVASSLWIAGLALERLDREINGGAPVGQPRRFPVGPLLEEVAASWRSRGGPGPEAVELRREGRTLELVGDRGEIGRALDNLLANAFEHGGPRVEIAAAPCGGRLRLAVVDDGGGRPGVRRPASFGATFAGLSGRNRRGHGLRIVRRVAAAHGGSFELRRAGTATEAVLELPLAGPLAGDGG
ncbi:MAG: ATP-binding protein [Solirubrobacterales bacterium]